MKKQLTMLVFWSVVIAGVVYTIYGVLMFKVFYPADAETATAAATLRGTFGDMFGLMNACFATMAFVGVVFTIGLQQKQSSIQQLENTFFNLMSLHQEVLARVTYNYLEIEDMKKAYGQEAFSYIYRDFVRIKTAGKDSRAAYNALIHPNYFTAYSYMRSFDSILRIVESHTGISDVQKAVYLKILFSHLSIYEFALMYQHFMADQEVYTMFEKYDLFKGLPDEYKI